MKALFLALAAFAVILGILYAVAPASSDYQIAGMLYRIQEQRKQLKATIPNLNAQKDQ